MAARSLFSVAVALGLSALLGACAGFGTVVVDVSSQGDWPVDQKPGSYAIERLPSQQANAAEQALIEAAAVPALDAAGFRPAPPEQADYLIQVGARSFEVLRRDPFASSLYWRADGWRYGGYHGYRPLFYGPGLGFVGAHDFPDMQRETAILIRDRRSQKIVYETRASQSSRGVSDALLPALFEASMKDFPLPALSPRSVTVALPMR